MSRAQGMSRVVRPAVAVVVTLLTGAVAVGAWILLQAQYVNDYCTTRAPEPVSARPEVGGRPAYLDGPVTVVCEYDGLPTVEVIDPVPFLGAVVLGVVVVVIGVVAARWARRTSVPPGA